MSSEAEAPRFWRRRTNYFFQIVDLDRRLYSLLLHWWRVLDFVTEDPRLRLDDVHRSADDGTYRLSIDEILDAKGSLVATRPSILPISDGSGIAMPGFGGATSGVLALVSEIFPFTGC